MVLTAKDTNNTSMPLSFQVHGVLRSSGGSSLVRRHMARRELTVFSRSRGARVPQEQHPTHLQRYLDHKKTHPPGTLP